MVLNINLFTAIRYNKSASGNSTNKENTKSEGTTTTSAGGNISSNSLNGTPSSTSASAPDDSKLQQQVTSLLTPNNSSSSAILANSTTSTSTNTTSSTTTLNPTTSTPSLTPLQPLLGLSKKIFPSSSTSGELEQSIKDLQLSTTVNPSSSKRSSRELLAAPPLSRSASSTLQQLGHERKQSNTTPSNATAATSNVVASSHKPRTSENVTEKPTTASDLLRMAMAQSGGFPNRPEDEELSGTHTPRPDMLDKRIPGIMHNFQQVCNTNLSRLRASRPVPAVEVTATEKDAVVTTSTAHHSVPSLFKSLYERLSPCHSPFMSSLPEHKSSELTSPRLSALKDTPPATPRATISAGSQESYVSINSTPATSTGPSSTSSGTVNAATPTIASPKGRLTVRIIAARDLRTTPNSPNGPQDPYVVCTFESNEFISKGPQRPGDTATKAMGIPGQKGMGITIPMKSRQSSNSNLKDLANKSGYTAPSWDHEAVL